MRLLNFFILTTYHFSLGQWLLAENSKSTFAQGKDLIWIPEYHWYMQRYRSPVYSWYFHNKMKQMPVQNCSSHAKPHGIIKKHPLLALSSCQRWHSPFFLHFIVDILTGIYHVETEGKFTCFLSQSTTLIEKTEGNQSRSLVSGEWLYLERVQTCHFYRQWSVVVRPRDLYRLGFDSWVTCLLEIRPWASYLVALCLSFPYLKLGKDIHLIELWCGSQGEVECFW